ncbi:MAG TPA: hypothetical protein VLC09_21625 [Polyangiaceae bacterium]|nr:hypothetical protein [Polyangiaceae bacterium]
MSRFPGVAVRLGAALLVGASALGCAGASAQGSAQGASPKGGGDGTAGPEPIVSPVVVVGPDGVADTVELLGRADAELAAERYAEAARLYQRVVDHERDATRRRAAWLGLGTARDLGGDPAGALDGYQRFLDAGAAGDERARIQVRTVRLLLFVERYQEARARSLEVSMDGRAPLERVALSTARAWGVLARDSSEEAERAAERDLARAADELESLGALYAERPPLDVAAWSLARGQLLERRAARIVFDPLPGDFAATLERRCQALLDAQSAYSDAMRSQSAHYSALAGVRVAALYQQLHHDLLAMPPPAAVDTQERRALFEASLRLRYAVLLEKAGTLLRHTVQMVERTGEGLESAERARAALGELEAAERAEQQALAAQPYSRAQLEQALRDLSERSRRP